MYTGRYASATSDGFSYNQSSNVGTLIQPITKAQFNAWEKGQDNVLPVPKALFSHNDQSEQWQTAVPQGMSQLSGWAGRAADSARWGPNADEKASPRAEGNSSC